MPKPLAFILGVFVVFMIYVIATSEPRIQCDDTQAIVKSQDQGYICVENAG